MWIQSRRVCDLYFCKISLAAIHKFKGRLNSRVIYSALGSNSAVILRFLHLSIGRKLLMCHTVECTFWNSWTVFVTVHFVHFNIKYSTMLGTYLLSVFNFTFLCLQDIKHSSQCRVISRTKSGPVMFRVFFRVEAIRQNS